MKGMKKRVLALVMTAAVALGGISYSGPVGTVEAAGESAVLTDASQLGTPKDVKVYDRVGVHDPSIVVGYMDGENYTSSTKIYGTQNTKKTRTEVYFVFGSHMAWAYSLDLENWKTFENNINRNYATIFKEDAEWSALGSDSYNVGGNLWAPDVIWNPEMQKWCMYMSVNGDRWYTSVVLLTADSLNGDWTRVGPVVYSGFTDAEQAEKTDLYKVIDRSEGVPERYTRRSRNGQATYSMNAIDPCVLYDEEGTLWMTYGSWFGGIYMLKLDEKSGLRDYDKTYPTKANESDAYQGILIAGGNNCSGEASYIQKIGDKWYLFMSYGGLVSTGGYNMRVFSSDAITGPYTDVSGEDARYGSTPDGSGITVVSADVGNLARATGSQLMNYYRWDFMKTGFTAQGHNSAFVDDDGKAYVVYHTRFDDGSEGHQVRVHQLFQAKNGGLVAAPFEYAGETLSESAYAGSRVVGEYNVLLMKPTNFGKRECRTDEKIQLLEDGTVTGAYPGTWEQTEDGPYVTLKTGNDTYQGVFLTQRMEESGCEAMCFTMVGSNDLALWGYKVADPTMAIRMTMDQDINLPKVAAKDLELPAIGFGGSTISWESKGAAMTDSGEVVYLKEDSRVVLTATITNGDYSFKKDYELTVLGSDSASKDSEIPLGSYYEDEELDISGLSASDYVQLKNPFYGTLADLSNGAVISFKVKRTNTAGGPLANLLSLNGDSGRLYFTGGSYLGYNGPGGFYDANINNFQQAEDLLKDNETVSIKLIFTKSGFEVYQDGKLAYSQDSLKEGTTKGGWVENINWSTVNHSLLDWLVNGAPYLNLGGGNWWPNDIFRGTVSDIVFSYIQPAMDVNGDGTSSSGLYSQDYEKVKDVGEVWTLMDDRQNMSLANADGYGNFLLFASSGSVSANSSAYTLFGKDVAWPDEYQLDFDLGLRAGNTANRSISQFAIVTNDTFTKNAEVSPEACILDLYVPMLTDTSIPQTWQINRDSNNTVTLPYADTEGGGWVHVSLKGNKTTGKGILTISEGDKNLYSGEVAIPANDPTGFFVLNGRGSGITKVDNIVVKNPNVDAADLTAYNTVMARARQFVSIQDAASCFTDASYEALNNAIRTAEETVTPDLTSDDQGIVDAQSAALLAAVDGLVHRTCTVTVDTSENGSVEGLAADGKYNVGSSLSLTAKPAAGYILHAWQIGSDTVGTGDTYSAVVTEDVTIRPVFVKGADRTEFDSILTEAEEKLGQKIYTEESLSALQKALITARIAVPASLPETQQTVVSEQIRLIDQAIEALQKVPDKEKEEIPDLVAPTLKAVSYLADMTLEAIALPDGWKWKQPATKLNAGTKEYTAVYLQTSEEAEISVAVNKASDPSYELPEGISGLEGIPLSAIVLPAEWQWKEPTEVLALNKAEYGAIFTHASGNYEPVEVNVPVTVRANVSQDTGNKDDTAEQKVSVSLSSSKVTLYTGKVSNSAVVKANVTGISSPKVTWNTSNQKVATVTGGTIKAVGKGTAKVTATVNGVSKVVQVTVKDPSIKVKKGKKAVSKVTVKKKKSVKLTLSVSPAKSGLGLAKLSKKDKKKVKVTLKNGKLTIKGKKKGKVTLKIQSGRAVKKIKVTVR